MTASDKADVRFVRDPSSWCGELARYAVAALIATGAAALLVHAFGTRDASLEATETDRAILIDLPAALAASNPASEAQVGPQQEAAEAAPATPPKPTPMQERQAVMEPAPPKPPDQSPKLVDPPAETPRPTLAAPQTPAEDPEPAEPTMVPPPTPAEARPPAAAPSAPTNAQAPAGSDAPVAGERPDSDEGRPHASARAITAWQRALVGRLEMAKRLLPNGATHMAMGTVQVAFAIDRGGRVVTERVARSSGSAALDTAALSLVRRAAPFPTPPDGVGERDLSFVVPIRFRH